MISLQYRLLFPLIFFIFISYIIFLADTADYNFAFKVIGDVPYGDKIAHALFYGIMAFLLNYGLNYRKIGSWHILLGSLLVLSFSTIEEFTQYFISSRTFDLGDLLANFIGVVLFSMLRRKK
ncbi:VanZ family protein [Campylobacterota bacterium DY0563]